MNGKPILVISDKTRIELNHLLEDTNALMNEVLKQDKAGVPGMEQVAERCQSCIDRITSFKEVNFPGKK